MEFLYEYGMFLAKTITFVLAVVGIIAVVAASAIKQGHKKGELEVTDISEQLKEVEDEITLNLLSKEALKEKEKQDKKDAKAKAKQDKENAKDGMSIEEPKLFVLNFNGSVDAKEVSALREEITALLMVANEKDEVLVNLESAGGMAHCYGLAASQLERIKQANIPLTISVDKVAASGGYMMACVANKIVAAPFAILGSIGVIAQIPNFNKILKKNDVEFEQLTAGEYKRTLTMFGENTEKGREKFKEELDDMHELFKAHVKDHRSVLDIDKVATGETWSGKKAIELNLIDELITSDDYVCQANKARKVVGIHYATKKGFADKFSKAASLSIDNLVGKLWQNNRIFPG